MLSSDDHLFVSNNAGESERVSMYESVETHFTLHRYVVLQLNYSVSVS